MELVASCEVLHLGHTVLNFFPHAGQNMVAGPFSTMLLQWGHLYIALSEPEKLAGIFFLKQNDSRMYRHRS